MDNKKMAVCYDSQACLKCYSCVVACSIENRVREDRDKNNDVIKTMNEKLPHYNYLTPVKSEIGVFPDIKHVVALKHCNHCENPKCMEICPTKAITKDTMGIVSINESLCIGCQSCIDACPFDVPVYSQEAGRTYKCVMCKDRLSAGLPTACSAACPSVAIFSGEREEIVAEAKKRAEHYTKVFGKEYIAYGADKVNDHVGTLSYMTIVAKEDQEEYLAPANPISKVSIARDTLKVVGIAGAAAIGVGIAAHSRHWNKNKENSPYNSHED